MSAKETLKQKLQSFWEDEEIQKAVKDRAGIWAGLINLSEEANRFIDKLTEYKAAQLVHKLRE